MRRWVFRERTDSWSLFRNFFVVGLKDGTEHDLTIPFWVLVSGIVSVIVLAIIF